MFPIQKYEAEKVIHSLSFVYSIQWDLDSNFMCYRSKHPGLCFYRTNVEAFVYKESVLTIFRPAEGCDRGGILFRTFKSSDRGILPKCDTQPR